GALHRPARLQASHDVEPPDGTAAGSGLLAAQQRLGAYRECHVERAADLHTEEARRRDPDHLERTSVQYDRLPDHTRVASEPGLPEPMRQHHAGRAASLLIV